MVLAPRNDDGEKVTALELEADELVTKPFGIEELLARVRARLREKGNRRQRFLRAGGIALDLETRRAEVQGRRVELTARELSLLEFLMRHPDEVLSRERLLSHAWGYDFDPGSNVVAVYVGYLRSKLGAERIETVRGAGYRLRE
jgi:two-component system, OmpR family, copper resistance phosphate regulon response regulator CusR